MKKFLIFFTIVATTHAFASLPANYTSQTAKEKQDILWANLESAKYSKLPPIPTGGWGSVILKIKSILTMNLTFDHTSDEMPASRGKNKFIHSSGSVAKIEFIPSASTPFTGVFKSGAIGLARLSVAADPASLGNFTPGMGFKLLVDGHPSVNVMAMYSLDGQGKNTNFFANSFSNHIAEPNTWALKYILAPIFAAFADDPFKLSIEHFAKVESNGKAVGSPVAPYQIIFVPTLQVQLNPNSKSDFRIDLSTIKAGTVMYIVKAKRYENDIPFEIGYVQLTSQLIPTEYGDHQLFFQHQRFGEDLTQ